MNTRSQQQKTEAGFSLVELLVVMTILLTVLGVVASIFTASLRVRDRETQKTDALTSVQAALNLMSREIANSGYGVDGNGIVLNNSNSQKVHFRANIKNDDLETNDVGEEIIYFYDPNIDSVVRYDRFAVPDTSVVINRVSNVTFSYYNYSGSSSVPTTSNVPTANTSKIKMTLMVQMDDVPGQPDNQNVALTTEIVLRNSDYMLNLY